MGNTLWVDVQNDDREPEDCSVMLRLQTELDALSDRLGISKPSSFFDYSKLVGQFDAQFDEGGDGAQPEELKHQPEPVDWYDAAEGERCAGALAREVRARPESLGFVPDASTSHWLERVIFELEDCRERLAAAAREERPFRLLIVP